MKKLFLVLMCILALTGAAFAGDLLINGAVATGESWPVQFNANEIPDKHTISCYYTDANSSVSAVTIDVEGANDPYTTTNANAHWYQLASHEFTGPEITAMKAMFHVVDRPVSRVRINITVLTGEDGSTDKFYVLYNAGRK